MLIDKSIKSPSHDFPYYHRVSGEFFTFNNVVPVQGIMKRQRVIVNAKTEFQSTLFDVETTFAIAKMKQAKKLRGADSPLYTAICPLVYIMRIFGYAPYTFVKDRLVPCNVYLIFSFCSILIYSYILYVVILRFMILKRETEVLDSAENIKVSVNYLVTLYQILMTIFTRSTFIKIWNDLQDYDVVVGNFGYPHKETKTVILVWTLLFLNTVLWFFVNQSGMYAFTEEWLYNMGYMLVYVNNFVALYKFIGMVFLLGQRFRHLNEITQKNIQSKFDEKLETRVDSKIVQNLHNDLMVIGESLSSLYSLSLLLWLASLSVHSVSLLYFIIRTVLSSWKHISWALILCLISWLTAFLSQLLILHCVCDFTVNQANFMGSILLDWHVHLIDRIPIEVPVEISLHLINRKLSFSAGGCFNVNLSLLRSITAIMTTYLVILLQLPN